MIRLGAALLAFHATAAAADPPPRVLPSRDVAATYRLAGPAADALPGGAPGLLRLVWDADGERLRAEADGRTQAAVVDLRAGKADIMDNGLRTALALPVREADVAAITLRGARLTRRGQDTVAGLPCTTYAVTAQRGTGTVCLTDDGVALSGQGVVNGRSGSFTATAVTYGAQPDALFRVPAGYLRLDMGGLNLGQLGRPR